MKIAIAGYGQEGKSNFEYFKTKGDVTIVDEREHLDDAPKGVKTILGKGAFSRLHGFDLIVRTAGLPPRKIQTDGKVWSATNEFFEKCKTPIIGVTGTKGKGTTASLIASILKASGQKTVLVGNIGVPALDALEEANASDVVVYELSSFQLWDLEKSPQVAVVLMIEADHLDVHASFEEYVEAKTAIRKYQTKNDVCFYHPTNEFSRRIAQANQNTTTAYRYNDPQEGASVHAEAGMFYLGREAICSIDALQLPGVHNIDNACAAISAALEYVDDWSAVDRGLRAFHGLEHRLKFVREVFGVRYFDDSIATTPGSAIAAIKAFREPKVLILGGSSKGADFSEVAKIAAKENVKLVLAIGSEAPAIEEKLKENNVRVINLGSGVSMPEIVEHARENAKEGDVVVLSPACASFGMFKNYKDRGDQFITAVNKL